MKRRAFLALPLIVTTVVSAKHDTSWATIQSVQEHLFAKNKNFPSAREFEATRYLKMVAYHDSFDSDDLDFILRGAKEIKKRGFRPSMRAEEKERFLRTFAESRFGENWLSLMINYTLEAMFCDPLYGGNKNEIGWRSYHHHAGTPRPKKRFGEKHG